VLRGVGGMDRWRLKVESAGQKGEDKRSQLLLIMLIICHDEPTITFNRCSDLCAGDGDMGY
jgi:hypothetical protein